MSKITNYGLTHTPAAAAAAVLGFSWWG